MIILGRASGQVLLDLATNLDLNAHDLDNNTPLLVAVQNLQTKASPGCAIRTAPRRSSPQPRLVLQNTPPEQTKRGAGDTPRRAVFVNRNHAPA